MREWERSQMTPESIGQLHDKLAALAARHEKALVEGAARLTERDEARAQYAARDHELTECVRERDEARAQIAAKDAVDVDVDALADRMWRVHPREVQDAGLTRAQWYAREIRAAFAMPARETE